MLRIYLSEYPYPSPDPLQDKCVPITPDIRAEQDIVYDNEIECIKSFNPEIHPPPWCTCPPDTSTIYAPATTGSDTNIAVACNLGKKGGSQSDVICTLNPGAELLTYENSPITSCYCPVGTYERSPGVCSPIWIYNSILKPAGVQGITPIQGDCLLYPFKDISAGTIPLCAKYLDNGKEKWSEFPFMQDYCPCNSTISFPCAKGCKKVEGIVGSNVDGKCVNNNIASGNWDLINNYSRNTSKVCIPAANTPDPSQKTICSNMGFDYKTGFANPAPGLDPKLCLCPSEYPHQNVDNDGNISCSKIDSFGKKTQSCYLSLSDNSAVSNRRKVPPCYCPPGFRNESRTLCASEFDNGTTKCSLTVAENYCPVYGLPDYCKKDDNEQLSRGTGHSKSLQCLGPSGDSYCGSILSGSYCMFWQAPGICYGSNSPCSCSNQPITPGGTTDYSNVKMPTCQVGDSWCSEELKVNDAYCGEDGYCYFDNGTRSGVGDLSAGHAMLNYSYLFY